MKRILRLFVLILGALMAPAAAYAQSIPGDVNGNGEVNIADLNAAIDVILGYSSNAAADVNGDGEINIADVNAIIDIIVRGNVEPRYEFVDLGLSSRTLWATCNIGATSPEDFGDYFAWGETEPKEVYSWETYKWCEGSQYSLTKYSSDIAFGMADGKTELDPQDDAAFVHCGPSCRMPNEDQIYELQNSCSWKWTQMNGVTGYLTTGRNGNTIFLPAAGQMRGSSHASAGYGYYWSRQNVSSDDQYLAKGLRFSSTDWTGFTGTQRCYGWTVRAVRVSQGDVFIEQKSLDLGGVPIGETRTGELNIINCTDETMTMTATVNEPFSFEQGNGSATSVTIEVPANSCTPLTVMLTATTLGRFDGNVTIRHQAFNNGQKVIPVHALAFSPDFLQRDCVDLGLPSGTLWATRDIGAESPLERGDKFEWGWTFPSSGAEMMSAGSDITIVEDLTENRDYLYDNTSDLSTWNDAAYVNWGPAWRMPSSTQISELIGYCTCYKVFIDGVFGRLVVGPNGNAMFMPANGYYWSRTYCSTDYAYGLVLESQNLDWNIFWGPIFYSHYVRAVRLSSNAFHVEPQNIDFGGVPVGETRTSQLTITNCTNETIGLRINADEPFLMLKGGEGVANTTIEIPGNQYVIIAVEFTATTPGQFDGNITIQSMMSQDEKAVIPVHARAYNDDFPDYDYVDLGLPSHTLWAAMNVGASNPEEFGDYFAWGETAPKETYSWETYKWCNGSATTLTKYNTKSSFGTVDNKTELEVEDDAAYVNWGPDWRMPTGDQIQELLDNCSWQWTTENGVSGQLVTGPNGNTMFLPASGYLLNQSSANDIGMSGRYWSSTLCSNTPRSSFCLRFEPENWFKSENFRSNGMTIRAVRASSAVTPKLYIEPQSLDLGEVAIGETRMGELTIVNNFNQPKTLTATAEEPFLFVQEEDTTSSLDVTVPGKSRVTVKVMFTATTPGEFNSNVTFRNPSLTGGESVIPVHALVISTEKWIDLGLPSGTLWATMNVGANHPEEYGDYFAWGETEPKEVYTWGTYKWCKGNGDTLTKYCTDSDYGTVDGKTLLDPQDDAAFVNWGPEWRIPSMDQIYELRRYCSSVRTEINGVKGRLLTGPNGNTIFLPGTGHFGSSSGDYSGDYWSRNSNNRYAEGLWTDGGYNSWGTFSDFRYEGHTIRAVRAPEADFYIEQQSLDLGIVPIGEERTGELTIVNNIAEDMTFTATAEDPFLLQQGESGVSTMTIVVPGQTSAPLTVIFNGSNPGQYDGNVTITSMAPDGSQRVITVHVLAYVDVQVTEVKEYVDLGLPSGTLWATKNVGASRVDEYGDYFAWGETEPKEVYSWETYKWCNGSENSLTKYCTDSHYGTVDGRSELEPEDDAACVNWGPAWRTPTKAQQDELERECIWRWTVANGVRGYLVIGPNGKSLFLPAAGYYVDDTLNDTGWFGYYWSHSISSYDEPECADGMGFNPQWIGGAGISRCYGWTVRPVRVSNDDVFIEQQRLDMDAVFIGETSTGNLTLANCTDESTTFTVTVDAPFSLKQGEGSASSMTVEVPAKSVAPLTVMFKATTPGEFQGDVTIQNPALDGGQQVIPVRAFAFTDDVLYQEYVDLGLPSGTLWATRDIGAGSPEEIGYYFRWGGTTPVNYMKADNMGNDNEDVISQCGKNSLNDISGSTWELGLERDAAYFFWGSEWRMPSLEQIQELIDCCTCYKARINGVVGRLVTGPNGNAMFWSADGYYWSRTSQSSSSYAYGIHLDSKDLYWGIFMASSSYSSRVRAVRASQD